MSLPGTLLIIIGYCWELVLDVRTLVDEFVLCLRDDKMIICSRWLCSDFLSSMTTTSTIAPLSAPRDSLYQPRPWLGCPPLSPSDPASRERRPETGPALRQGHLCPPEARSRLHPVHRTGCDKPVMSLCSVSHSLTKVH